MRFVTGATKDHGNIHALCGSGWEESSDDIITKIANGTETYAVRIGTRFVRVVVAHDPNGDYLKTEADERLENNLDSLPPCGWQSRG